MAKKPSSSASNRRNFPRDKKFLLREIQKFSHWEDTANLEVVLAEYLEKYPDDKDIAEEKIAFGKYLKECEDTAYKLGSSGKSETELRSLQKEMEQKGADKDLIQKMEKSYQIGVATRKRALERIAAKKKQNTKKVPPLPEAEVRPLDLSTPLPRVPASEQVWDVHPNFPANLSPAKSWTILIDETGECFTEEVFTPIRQSRKGKCVAILVPEGYTLPDLPKNWHAIDVGQSEIEKNVETLRNSPCGILGITAESLNPVDCDLWFSCIESLLDLILRLLPLEEKTKIQLFVEQRGIVNSQNTPWLQKTCNDALHHLSRSFPERAKKITIRPRIIRKDGHPWNGYVDAAAFLWGSPVQEQLLQSTGWLNTCFLGTDAIQLRNAMDVLQKVSHLTSEEWSALVLSVDTCHSHSLVSILLEHLGEEARRNPDIWNTYLNHVQNHLYSKAIHLFRLSRQIRWLKKYQPEDHILTPRLQLIWLTVQLAESNHLGKTDAFQKNHQEFQKLCRQLYYEDAPLVCLATLHIAVAFMNEFDFKQALKAVRFWNDIPIEVPGRQYHGQVLSTYGQLLAFMGKNEEAVNLFQRALEQFRKLSDKQQGKLDSHQTQAYQLIAMMDSEQTSVAAINKKLESYLGMSLEEAIDQMAPSDQPKDKYAHHVLLRYLLLRGSDAQKERYLSRQQDWKQGTGHPWEWILFYRALLTEDTETRASLMRRAYEIALEGGATLRAIACVILGGLYYSDKTCQKELQTLTEQVISELPHLGKHRVKVLQCQLESPLPPLELAKEVLPFNFR